jgi:flagellar motility protein MotE (MotC chaperone)
LCTDAAGLIAEGPDCRMSFVKNNTSHVLLTLGVLFTIGGATRFLPGDLAFAEDLGLKAAEQDAAAAGKLASKPAGAPAAGGPDEVCFTTESAAMVAEDQWLFESQKEELKKEQLALQAWEKELQTQTAELQTLQTTLEDRWQQIQMASDADIKHLAGMYSIMKPDQAATIFNQMDPAFAAGFLRLMASEQAGMILANMDSKKAYVISVKLATMNADVRNAPAGLSDG